MTSLKYNLSPGYQYKKNPANGKSCFFNSGFPWQPEEPAYLGVKAAFYSSIVLQECFLSSWRLFKYLLLMWASKPPLKSFLHFFASPQTWGFVSAHALSLHERALLFWAFLIFMKWGKWCRSSGRNEERLNWNQLFCLWSPNARILEEMGIGGDANMYVWSRKCFEVMQLSVPTF